MRCLLILAATAATAFGQRALVDALSHADGPTEVLRVIENYQAGVTDLATIYANSYYNGGSNDGSLAHPYTTIAAFSGSVAANDTVVLGGIFRESWTLANAGVTVRAYTGAEWDASIAVRPSSGIGWYMRGDVVSSTWTAHGTYTNTYVAAVNAADAKPAGVVIDWDLAANIWSDGRHAAHLEEAASAALCDATAGTWFWNTTELLVHPPTGLDLNAHTVAWCRTGKGLTVSADGVTINDGTFYLWFDTASGQGYSILGAGVSDLTVNRANIIASGYHGIGAAVGKCTNNWFNDCTVTGGNYACDSYFIMFSASGQGNVETSGFRNCTARLSPLLKYGAVEATEAFTDYIVGPSAATPNQIAYSAHSGTGIAAGGVSMHNCTAVILGVTSASYSNIGWAGGTNGVEPTDKWDPATYPIAFYDSHLQCDRVSIGEGASASVFQAAVAFVRTYIDGATCQASWVGAGSTPNVVYCNRSWVLFESCVLTGVGGSSSGEGGLIRLRGTSSDFDCLYVSNSSISNDGDSYGIFHRVDANPILNARHSVFRLGGSDTHLCSGNTTDTNKYAVSKCWYDVDIGDTTFGAGTSYNTQTEWTTSIDANGTYDVDWTNTFAHEDTMEPKIGSTLFNTYDTTANAAAPMGINLIPYKGNAGAWQHQTTGVRSRDRLPRGRRKF